MKNAKVIIAGVALVAALGLFIFRGKGEDAVPNTDATRTQWICLACHKPFSLTAAEFETASASSGKAFLVRCPACSEIKGVRAAECSICKERYAMTNSEGDDTPCPKCNPVTVKAQQKPDAEEAEPEAKPAEEAPQEKKPVMFVQ